MMEPTYVMERVRGYLAGNGSGGREFIENTPDEILNDLNALLAQSEAAWDALPESVSGDNAPVTATLAHRIAAVVSERNFARNNHKWCHEKLQQMKFEQRDGAADVDE